MFELMWNVTEFANDQSLWPSDGSDALVYSMDLGYDVPSPSAQTYTRLFPHMTVSILLYE